MQTMARKSGFLAEIVEGLGLPNGHGRKDELLDISAPI